MYDCIFCDVWIVVKDLFLIWNICSTPQGNLCATSMDSLMNTEDCGFSIRSKENLLFFAATTQSTMDYSMAPIEDGVVDSPPARTPITVGIRSPSPLRQTRVRRSPVFSYGNNIRTQRTLYARLPQLAEPLKPKMAFP